MNFVHRHTPILLTICIAACLQAGVKVEWSLPYCLSQADGPMSDAFGLPLPDEIFNGAVSAEDYFMPHVYLLNLTVLSLALFPVVLWGANRLTSPARAKLRTVFGATGLVGIIVVSASVGAGVKLRMLTPVRTIGFPYGSYSEFRPVAVRFGRPREFDCIPSRFWFPDGWQHR